MKKKTSILKLREAEMRDLKCGRSQMEEMMQEGPISECGAPMNYIKYDHGDYWVLYYYCTCGMTGCDCPPVIYTHPKGLGQA
jgi:hypothetical protein